AVRRPDLAADDLVATATTSVWPTRYALRTADAKLIERVDDGASMVYDLRNDPSERRNLLLSNPAAADGLTPRLVARRLPLAEQGIQVRIVGPVAGVASFRFALQALGDSASFDTLARTSGPVDTRVALSRDGHWLRVKGKTDAGGRGF